MIQLPKSSVDGGLILGVNRYQRFGETGSDGVRCPKALWRGSFAGGQKAVGSKEDADVEFVHERWETEQPSLRKAAKGKGVNL